MWQSPLFSYDFDLKFKFCEFESIKLQFKMFSLMSFYIILYLVCALRLSELVCMHVYVSVCVNWSLGEKKYCVNITFSSEWQHRSGTGREIAGVWVNLCAYMLNYYHFEKWKSRRQRLKSEQPAMDVQKVWKNLMKMAKAEVDRLWTLCTVTPSEPSSSWINDSTVMQSKAINGVDRAYACLVRTLYRWR